MKQLKGRTPLLCRSIGQKTLAYAKLGEEKSAYYYEDNVSIQACGDETLSFASLSDETDHKAAATWASMSPILNQCVEKGGIKKINIVSDSPTSQYRNKSIFYFMQDFCEKSNIFFKWIYLEAGHGKGIPDGIEAVVKQAISDIVPFNPEQGVYGCNDMLKLGLRDIIPSISIHTY